MGNTTDDDSNGEGGAAPFAFTTNEDGLNSLIKFLQGIAKEANKRTPGDPVTILIGDVQLTCHHNSG